MSDFDDVLERLVGDPAFRDSLAADPGGTLSGYDLSAEELDLLNSQYSMDTGGHGAVEERASKASLFGLLGPLAGMTGLSGGSLDGHGLATGIQGGAGHLPTSGLDPVTSQGLNQVGGGSEGFATVGDGTQQGLDPVGGYSSGLYDVNGGGAQSGLVEVGGGGSQSGLVEVGGGGSDGGQGGLFPVAAGGTEQGLVTPGDHTPVGYHPHIDADGDGHWDQYTAVQHADGSVDISVDRNHDGIVDFVGHDQNHDGLVESADYDEDFNGTFETHMRDVNGDGWLDTRTVDPEPPVEHS